MKKKVPHFKTDKEMEEFLEQDLSDYLHADNFVKVEFEFLPKDEQINLRLPAQLLSAVKKQAKKAKIPYQRYIRQIIERDLSGQLK